MPQHELSLTKLERRFSDWRAKRKVGDRIPTSLWNAATKVARKVGINRVAMTLRLDYYSLKKCVDATQVLAASDRQGAVSFVEIPASSLPDSMPTASNECIIEFEKASGDKMRIQFRGSVPDDLASLGRNFWSCD